MATTISITLIVWVNLVIHKFRIQRKLIEELELTVEYPDNMSSNDILHDVRLLASKSDGWEVILVDRPEVVESDVNFGDYDPNKGL